MTNDATNPVEVPDAYLYSNDEGSKELILDCNGEYARRLIELGYTETPLFTRIASRATDKTLAADIEVLRKLAKSARDAEIGCRRVVELLTPEWERFEKRDGSHNRYVSRLYADHVSSARTNKRDADALERILTSLEGQG